MCSRYSNDCIFESTKQRQHNLPGQITSRALDMSNHVPQEVNKVKHHLYGNQGVTFLHRNCQEAEKDVKVKTCLAWSCLSLRQGNCYGDGSCAALALTCFVPTARRLAPDWYLTAKQSKPTDLLIPAPENQTPCFQPLSLSGPRLGRLATQEAGPSFPPRHLTC